MISLCLTSLFTKQLLMHYLRRLRHHKCSSMYCLAYKTASLVHQSWNRFKTRSCFFLKNNFLFNCSFQTQSMAFKRTFFLYPFCSHSIPTFAKDRPFLNRINFSEQTVKLLNILRSLTLMLIKKKSFCKVIKNQFLPYFTTTTPQRTTYYFLSFHS